MVAAVLASAALAVAADPSRQADKNRALHIGLALRDIGAGWTEASGKRSPYSIDTGSAVGSSLTAACEGSATTKTETDIVVTAGALSAFAHSGGTLVSIVMIWKTPLLAQEQVADLGDVAALKACIASELSKSFAADGFKTTLVGLKERPFTTPDQQSDSLRIAARLRSGATSRLVYLDLVCQQDGRGLVESVYLSFGGPTDGALEHRIAAISSTRLLRYAV